MSPAPLGVSGPNATLSRRSLLSGPQSRFPSLISLRRNGTSNPANNRITNNVPTLNTVHSKAMGKSATTPPLNFNRLDTDRFLETSTVQGALAPCTALGC